MAMAVSVAGYQVVRLPFDEQGPHGAFLDAAGVLLGVLMIVAMSSNIGPFARSRLRGEGTTERSRVGIQRMFGILMVLLVILWNLRLLDRRTDAHGRLLVTAIKALFMTVWCPDSRSVESNCLFASMGLRSDGVR